MRAEMRWSPRVQYIERVAQQRPIPSVQTILTEGGKQLFPESFWYDPAVQDRLQAQLNRRSHVAWSTNLLLSLFCPELDSISQAPRNEQLQMHYRSE